MLDRTLAYNRVVADSTNQVLLLNIVRASERLPTYYTRLEADSSSLGITPNGTLNLPLSNPRSFETDSNIGPTGVITSSATKAVASLAGFASSLGLSATESNILTLQTLDDQKYQNGMMTPVPLKNIQAFQDEGYQRDLMYMMFLGSIAVSGTMIDTIDAAATARCAEALPGGQPHAGMSFEQQLCAYRGSGPYQTLFDPEKAHPADYSFSLRTCQTSGGAVSGDAFNQMVRFNNDPAREGRGQSARETHPEICFQIALDDLLILGLQVGSPNDVPATLVDVVPDALAQDPKFRSDIIQQNFFFRETSSGVTAICKKKAADNGFTLAFTNPNARQPAPLTNLLQQLTPPPDRTAPEKQAADTPPPPPPAPPAKKGARPAAPIAPAMPAVPAVNPNAAYPAEPLAACQLKNPGTPETPQQAVLASSDEQTAANQGLKPLKLNADKISFSTRSFEAMIYYLGEAVRYEDDPQSMQIGFPHVLGRNPAVAGAGYVETMFYSSSHLPDTDTAIKVRDDSGKTYGLPKYCMTAGFDQVPGSISCSAEYPDNESLDVLNFVNAVWGLQKESTQGPTSPLVVVTPQ